MNPNSLVTNTPRVLIPFGQALHEFSLNINLIFVFISDIRDKIFIC